MSNKPWDKHPVQKLKDIACGADRRTQVAIREWMDCYVESFANELVLSEDYSKHQAVKDLKAPLKRRKLQELGSIVAELCNTEEDMSEENDLPHTRTRYTMYAILPKRKGT